MLAFAQQQIGTKPSALDWTDLDAPLISAFLDHLETDRENSPRARNARLTAIRSRFNYAALRHPEHAAIIQRVLAIPPKRFDKPTVSFLPPSEIDALIAAPEQRTWEGRRDRTLLLVAVQTGLRVSELIGLNCGDATLGTGAHLRCEGKGRKQRAVPLTNTTEAVLRVWLQRTWPATRRPAVPHAHRPPAQQGRGRTTHVQARRDGRSALPLARNQAADSTRAQVYQRDVVAPRASTRP